MNEIFVTNNNDFLHTDSFDGSHYAFPPGEKVLLPVVAARLFFGFGQADKTEALVRQGWANPVPGRDPDEGVRKLANFVFTQGMVVEIPVDSTAPVEEEAAQA